MSKWNIIWKEHIMGKRRGLTAVLATLVSLSLFAAPVMANPGNGNGNGMAAVRATAVATRGIKVTRGIMGKKEIRPRKTTVLPIIVKITANPIMSPPISASPEHVRWP